MKLYTKAGGRGHGQSRECTCEKHKQMESQEKKKWGQITEKEIENLAAEMLKKMDL